MNNKNANGHNGHSDPNSNNKVEKLGKETWEALMKLHSANTSNEDRKSADRFLSEYLPNERCCWQIFAKFLSTDNIPHEAHFFAANMLRSKIQRNLHQVPLEHHIGLDELIISTLINFNKKGDEYENIRTQLSIGFALLSIQRTDWVNKVENIINKLAKTDTLNILLNILTRLAEELYTFHIPISNKIKHKASNILRKHAPLVLKLLHDLFQMLDNNHNHDNNHHNNTKLKIFKCFAAWLDFMDTHFQAYMNNFSVLTKICFSSLQNDHLFKDACTCISKILRLSDGDTRRYYDDEADADGVPPEEKETDKLIQREFNILVPNILSLKSMYLDLLNKYNNHSDDEDCIEKCYGLCRLFVDTAEHYTDWIISGSIGRRECEELINIILLCNSHPDPIISTYCCVFWEKLFVPFRSIAKEFSRHRANTQVCEVYDEFERPWPDWCKPYVNSLIFKICTNTVLASKLPADFEDMDTDQQEEALQIRWQLSDIIADICQIIGLLNVFDILYKMLVAYIEANVADIYRCEAILFCIRNTYKALPMAEEKESHPLYKIFKLLPALPNEMIVNSMCIQLVNVHCNFIHPTFDAPMFEYLYQYIFNNLLLVPRECVRAIREICTRFEADIFSGSFIIALFNIYANNSLHVKDELVLLEGITCLICTFQNENDMKQGINKLLDKQCKLLDSYVEMEDEEALYDRMNCISCIFKYFRPEEKQNSDLNVKLLENMWPSMELILNKFTAHDGIMEKTTRIIKHVIRNNCGNYQFFMQSSLCIEALKLMTMLYCTKSQRSSFLYIIWIYVDEFIEKNEYAAKELLDTLIKISQCTFNILKNDEEVFNKYQDIVEDFYELLVQYIKKSNQLLTQNKDGVHFLFVLFEKATYGLLLDQIKSNDAICQFFTQFVYNIPQQIVDKMLFDCNANQNQNQNQPTANQIIFKILYGLSGQVRYEIANNLAKLLNVLYKYDKKKVENIVVQTINNNAHFLDLHCDDPTKQEFITQYFNNKYDSKKRCKICIEWFTACQRYQRSKTF